MLEKGRKIRKFGHSKSLRFVWIFFAVLIGGAGAFVLSCIPKVGESFNFSGDISILYKVGYGAIGVAGLIILITMLAMKSQASFVLYENAIQSMGKQGNRTDYFEDIEDLFIFLYGGFGYRTSEKNPWIYVGGKTSGYAQLTKSFRELHIKYRADKLFKELQEGKTVVFHYLSDSDAKSKSFAATRNLKLPTFDIKLTRHHLTINDTAIPIKRIAKIKTNYWFETSKIIDVEGNVFYKIHPAAIMSFDVLYHLLVRLQESEDKIS